MPALASAAVPTYHVVPHTHWDREWYLAFDEFRVLLVHLLDDLLALLDRRPEYAGFLLDGQTSVLDDYLDVRPDRRDVLDRHIRAGRVEVGPWYVLPDSFLVSGEALVRNLMRGRAAARAFGGSPAVGYIPDSFGHTAQLPQLLRGFGMDTAIVWRGFGGEPGEEGAEYRWRAPDGSTVLMEHLSDVGYSAAYFESADEAAVTGRFDDVRRRLEARAHTAERLVLSGGDHHWPTAHLPEALAHLNAVSGGAYRVVHGTLGGFADALRRATDGLDLPLAEGELRFGYRWAFNVTGGVYSSRMHLKQANAAAQRLLERTLEPLDALATRAGGASQQALLQTGWTYLLQNHPHDSICGCSIDAVHREMATRYEKLDALGRGVERFAWQTLAPGPEGDPGDDATVTVWNPSPFHRDEVATFDVRFFRQQVVVGLNPDVVPDAPLPPVAGFALRDAEGRAVPFEVVARGDDYGIAYTRYGYPAQSRVERFTVRASLRALPPLGFRTLCVVRTDGLEEAPTGVRAGDGWIENALVRVEADADGSFRVTDLAAGVTYGPLGHFEDGADAGDLYNYSPPPSDRVLRSTEGAEVTVETLPGRLEASLLVRGVWNVPSALTPDLARRADRQATLSFTTTASLTPLSAYVRFETTLDNTARDHRLRVLFETGRRTNAHHADNAFAVLSRTQRACEPADFAIEVPAAVAPMHRFVTVEDDEAGATLLADGLPEYELKHDSGGVLALTLLRCVGDLAREGLAMRPGGRAGWQNETPEAQGLGTHRFRYAFLPHPSGWAAQAGRIQRAAESFLLPLRIHAGAGAASAERGELDILPEALALSALKVAEDGDGFVLRVVNPTPLAVEGTIRFYGGVGAVHRADLEERPGERLEVQGRELHDVWPPFRIRTYRFTLHTPEVP